MNDEIKDMSLEHTDEEKERIEKEGEKAVEDMSLDEPQTQIPSATEIGIRLAKTFPDIDVIDTGTMKIMKMMDSSYTINGTKLADLKDEELVEIDNYIQSKEKE